MRALRALAAALAAAGLLAPAPAPAGPGGRCSLAWADIVRNFGPGSEWRPAGPPVPIQPGGGDDPACQAQLFASAEEGETALIIAEWGDPDSPELGVPVYCAVRDANGRVLEEVGANPAATGEPAAACRSESGCV